MITDPAERRASYISGCFAVRSPHLEEARLADTCIELVDSELDLINTFIDRVREWDPDVLTGWELQNSSWGYLAERAWKAYGELV